MRATVFIQNKSQSEAYFLARCQKSHWQSTMSLIVYDRQSPFQHILTLATTTLRALGYTVSNVKVTCSSLLSLLHYVFIMVVCGSLWLSNKYNIKKRKPHLFICFLIKLNLDNQENNCSHTSVFTSCKIKFERSVLMLDYNKVVKISIILVALELCSYILKLINNS